MERAEALAGIRVVDLSWIVAGPQCTRILADFGAEVIRVEYGQTLDSIRMTPPVVEGKGGATVSGLFNNLNRNKLSVTVNVMHPRGMELLRRLISVSDVVVENYSSRVLERWGLGYEEQCRLRPDIIYLSLSGFGHSGRCRDYTTWGPTAQALSGLTFMSGLPGHEPAGWGFSYMDHTAGFYGCMAILMALHHRNRTGQGQYIDLSQVEAGIVVTGPSILDYTVNGRPYRRPGDPPGNRSIHPSVAPHGAYRCRGEDRWCAISVFSEEEWRALCRVMGDPAWAQAPEFATNLERVRNQDGLDSHIEEWTLQHAPEEAMSLLQQAGVPAGVVQTAQDKVDHDPQLRFRGFLPEAEHPEIGAYKVEGVPLQMSRSPWRLKGASPVLGSANSYVFGELLGLADAEIGELAAQGAI
ncbi:MAG: CoA transferase [Chloroflexi bacterium]|nr:CoA transferase [Chloroflexota bacterium]